MLRSLFVLLLLLAAGHLAWGQRCGFTDTVAIGDIGTTDITISIADYLNDDISNGNQGLCNVTLYFQHSYVYDLVVTLTSPAGQSVQLVGPLNAQSRPATNLARWFVDFIPCDSTAAPDAGAPPVWSNNDPFNWAAFANYTGAYRPANGCFADFNRGPVNGDWTLTFDNQRSGQSGRLTYVLLEFCDDRNREGPCCFAAAGDLRPAATIEACEEQPQLTIDLASQVRYRQPRPPAEQYGYTFAVARNDSILMVTENPDLGGMPAGEYEICGLSYRRGELNQLALDGSLSFTGLRQDFNAVQPAFCGDLTPTCQRVRLFPRPDTTRLTRTLCTDGVARVGGQEFSATGLYPVSLTGRAGCDSIVILDLEIVDVLRETIDTVICAEATYPQAGNLYDQSGTYVDTVLSVLGCDSIVTLNLAVAPPIVVDTAAAICAGDTFFLGTEPFFVSTTATRTITAVNGCDSTVNLDLFVLEPEIRFNDPPASLDCNTPSFLLDAGASNLAFTQSVRWLDTLGNVLSPDLTLRADTAGVYIFSLEVGRRGTSCSVRDSVTLRDDRFAVTAALSVTDGAGAQVPCPGPEEQCAVLSCRYPVLTINARPAPLGPAYTYAWTIPPGGSSTGATDGPALSVDAPGTYGLRITDPATGCRFDTSYTVGMDTLRPSAAVRGNALLNCAVASLDFSADTLQARRADLEFTWFGACLSGSVSGPTLPLSCPGPLTLTVRNRVNGCTADTTVLVQQDLAPVSLDLAPASAPLSCADPVQVLNAAGTSANGLRYAWTFGGLPDTIGRAASLEARRVGEYTVVATDVRSRCVATASTTVTGDVTAPVAVSGPARISLNCNEPTTVLGDPATSSGPSFRYRWTDLNDPGTVLGNTPTLSVAPPGGLYELTVEDDRNGCTTADTTAVTARLDTPFVRLELPLEFDCFVDSVAIRGRRPTFSFPSRQRWFGPCLPPITDTSQVWVYCPGTYYYEVQNLETGCSARDSLTVGLAATGVVAVLPDTAFLDCTTGATRLDRSAGTDAPVVRWFRDGVAVELVGDRPRVTVPGTYTLVLANFNESCRDTARTVVVADCPALAVIVPPDSLTCTNSVVQLDAGTSVPAQGPNTRSEWLVPAGANTQPGATSRQLTVFSPGRFGFVVRNLVSGATDTAYVTVVRNVTQPVAEAGPRDTLNCYEPTVILDAGASSQAPNLEYLWTTTGDDTLSFDQQLPVTAAGTYLLRVTNRGTGCSRVDNVTVRQDIAVPVLSFSETVIPCDTVDFALAVIPGREGRYAFAWTGPAILADSQRDTVRISDVGSYEVEVTNLGNGCPVTGSVSTSRAPCPPFPALPDTSLTCKADTLQLIATFRDPCLDCNYRWTRNGVPVSGQSDSILPVTRTGVYEILVFNAAGLRGGATSTVTDTRIVPAANAGPDHLLTCTVKSALLGNPDPEPDFSFRYRWLGENGIPVPGATTDSLRVSTGNFYQLETINTFSNCVALDTVRILYDTVAPLADAGPGRLLDCNNKRRTLDGINSSLGDRFRYSWSGGPSPLCLEGGSTLNPIVRCGGEYQLTVTDTVSGCTATETVLVTNDDELPAAIPLADTLVDCAQDSVVLRGLPREPLDRVYRWERVLNGGNVVVPESAPGAITVTDAGSFRYVVENTATGCSNEFTVRVRADLARPTAEAGPVDTFYCALDSLLLTGRGATTSGRDPVYGWSSGTGFFVDNAASPTATIYQPDIYSFSVTDPGNSCTTVDTVLIARDVSAPFALAGNDTTLTCTRREIRLAGNFTSLSGQATYTWTTRDGNIVGGNQTATPLVDAVGRYQLNVTDPDNGCAGADIVVVSEDTLAPVADIELPRGRRLNCYQSELLLRAEGTPAGVSYLWEGPQGAVGSADEQMVNAAGSYRLLVTSLTNGCQDTARITVEEDQAVPETEAIATAALSCERDSVEVALADGLNSPFFQYQWLDENDRLLGDAPRATVGRVGTYRLITQDVRNGCRDTAAVFVDANEATPVVVLAEPLVLNCDRSFTTLDASGSSRGDAFTTAWVSPNNSAVPSGDPYQVRGSVPGTYYFTVTNRDNGCAATDSVELRQSALAVEDLEFAVDQPACSDDRDGSITVLGVNGGQGPFRFRLDNGLLTERMVYEGLPIGRHTLEVVGADGCSTTSAFLIEEGPQVFLELRSDTLIRLGDSISLDFSTNLTRWDSLVWTSSGPLPPYRSDGPLTVSPISSQGYRLLIIGPDGCNATDELVIEVDGTVRLFVPNVFSPNSDGKNDKIRPFFAREVVRILDFRIFDRFGEMLYDYADDPSRDGEDFGWDGHHEGVPMNPQVFVWTLEVLLLDGETLRVRGDFALMR